jgi:hypothetical protein
MADFLSPNGVPMKPFGFGNFIGMDTAHDRNAMDTGDKQALFLTRNCHADRVGLIMRDPGAIRMPYAMNRYPIEINFYGPDGDTVWAEMTGGDVDLVSDDGVRQEGAFLAGSSVSSLVYQGLTWFMSPGQEMWGYNGAAYRYSLSATRPQPGFGCVIGRRMAVAGMPGKPTEIWFSRTDDPDTWPLDEDPNSTDALRASFLDIKNLIGTADKIVGLATFEVDRLAIFTQTRVLIYAITPDLSTDQQGVPSWLIDDRASINIGSVSHGGIVPINVPQSIGATLLYVSHAGVYKLERVGYGGAIIYANPVSNIVSFLIRNLIDQTVDVTKIDGYYDAINNQAHFFFPRPDGYKRATFTVPPDPQSPDRWSVGDFLGMSCGAQMGDYTMLGGAGGIYRMAKPYQYATDTIANEYGVELPEMTVETPLLWHGDLVNKKQSMMFVMQAAGHGEVVVEAFDELNRALGGAMIFPLSMTPFSGPFPSSRSSTPDAGMFPDVPIDLQFARKFEFDYRGVWFRFTGRGLGLIRISAFAVFVRQPEKKR